MEWTCVLLSTSLFHVDTVYNIGFYEWSYPHLVTLHKGFPQVPRQRCGRFNQEDINTSLNPQLFMLSSRMKSLLQPWFLNHCCIGPASWHFSPWFWMNKSREFGYVRPTSATKTTGSILSEKPSDEVCSSLALPSHQMARVLYLLIWTQGKLE